MAIELEGEADAARQDGGPGGKPGPASPIGAVTVPPRREGTEASVLPQAYQDLVEVAADAGRPLRAGEFSNGDFEEYWRFHLTCEHQRLYPGVNQGQYALSA